MMNTMQNLEQKVLRFKTVDPIFLGESVRERRINEIPEKFRRITLTGKALDIYKQCLFKSCYLFGAVGTGKTTIARKLQEAYTLLDYHVIFAKTQDIVIQNENYYRFPGEYTEPITKYTQNCVLIIDDLGVTARENKEHELLFQIVDFRYDHELPTIFTSNLRVGSFEERLSDRIQGICDVAIELTGVSLR